KDADTVIALGLPGTTNPLGAKNWRDSYTNVLTGADVILLPDNDEKGQEHVAVVRQHLAGHVKSFRVVTVPGPHKDISDWFHAGSTRADLDALLQQALSREQEAAQRSNGHIPGPEPLDPYACPELPKAAQIDTAAAADASLFLSDYIAFSAKWAP